MPLVFLFALIVAEVLFFIFVCFLFALTVVGVFFVFVCLLLVGVCFVGSVWLFLCVFFVVGWWLGRCNEERKRRISKQKKLIRTNSQISGM